MKNFTLASFTAMALCSQPAMAHPMPAVPHTTDLALNQRASTMTFALVNQLRLNEAEYIRLRSVHCVLLAAIDSIDTKFAQNPALRQAKLQELQGYYEQERVRVLTPTQVSRLEEKSVHDNLPTINTTSGGLG